MNQIILLLRNSTNTIPTILIKILKTISLGLSCSPVSVAEESFNFLLFARHLCDGSIGESSAKGNHSEDILAKYESLEESLGAATRCLLQVN